MSWSQVSSTVQKIEARGRLNDKWSVHSRWIYLWWSSRANLTEILYYQYLCKQKLVSKKC